MKSLMTMTLSLSLGCRDEARCVVFVRALVFFVIYVLGLLMISLRRSRVVVDSAVMTMTMH